MTTKYLHINGYPVHVRDGFEVSTEEISGQRGYSFNGFYQFTRNTLARRWAVQTMVLPGDEAIALAGMLNMRGDGWRWDLPSGVNPNGVHYIVDDGDAEGYSDKRRVQQAAEAKATIMSAYGADGARVYDWNGNAYAPFSGCQGSLIVDGGTTNFATFNDWKGAWARNIGTETLDTADSDHYWTGTTSGEITTVASTNAGVVTSSVYTPGAGRYTAGDDVVASVFIKPDAGGEGIRIAIYESTGGAYTEIGGQDYTIISDADGWQRIFVQATTDVASAGIVVKLLNVTATVQTWNFNGFQLEVDPGDGYPSAPVKPNEDPWGSGNGVRPAGVLDYDQWMYDFDKGFTVSAWINLQYTGAAGSRVFFRNSNTSTYTQLYISSGDSLIFDVRADVGSALQQAQTGFTTLGWHHVVGTYSARDRAASLYTDGALVGTDSSWNGAREFVDPSKFGIDFAIGSIGNPGFDAKIPLGPIQFYPFTMPAHMVTGLYNSATDDVPVPGVMPLACHGLLFGAGEQSVKCYAENVRIRSVPHKSPWTGNWEPNGAELTFELVEAVGR